MRRSSRSACGRAPGAEVLPDKSCISSQFSSRYDNRYETRAQCCRYAAKAIGAPGGRPAQRDQTSTKAFIATRAPRWSTGEWATRPLSKSRTDFPRNPDGMSGLAERRVTARSSRPRTLVRRGPAHPECPKPAGTLGRRARRLGRSEYPSIYRTLSAARRQRVVRCRN